MAVRVEGGAAYFDIVSNGGVQELFAVWESAPDSPRALDITKDTSNLIDGNVHCLIHDIPFRDSHYLTVDSQGNVVERFERTDAVGFSIALCDGSAGNPRGTVMYDNDNTAGGQLGWMGLDYGYNLTASNSVPSGRSDLDVMGAYQDVSGNYGGGILLADTDTNTNSRSAIYELRDVTSSPSYREISIVSSNTRRYGDLAIARSGAFGGLIYVSETLTDTIQQVAPNGTHVEWASGFSGIDAIAISDDGQFLYAIDDGGIWLIEALRGQSVNQNSSALSLIHI